MDSRLDQAEKNIQDLLAELRRSIPHTSYATLDKLKVEITRLSTGAFVLDSMPTDGSARDPLWFDFGLTPTEAKTMIAMAKSGPTGISKERLMSSLYYQRVEDWPDPKILDILIHKIRAKLGKNKAPYWIETIHGSGWVLHEGLVEPRKGARGMKLWCRASFPSRRNGQRSKA